MKTFALLGLVFSDSITEYGKILPSTDILTRFYKWVRELLDENEIAIIKLELIWTQNVLRREVSVSTGITTSVRLAGSLDSTQVLRTSSYGVHKTLARFFTKARLFQSTIILVSRHKWTRWTAGQSSAQLNFG